MNYKRYTVSAILGFIFMFVYDAIFHGSMLMSMYESTAHLWRTKADMEAYFPLAALSQFLIAAVAAFIFTRHYEGKGIMEGVRFGLMVGALFGIGQFSMVAYMPVPMMLATSWFIGTLLQFVGLGVIFSLVYKKA